MRRLNIGRLVYVSGNPAALARDSKRLIESPIIACASIQPLDLAPQTYYIDAIAYLRALADEMLQRVGEPLDFVTRVVGAYRNAYAALTGETANRRFNAIFIEKPQLQGVSTAQSGKGIVTIWAN